MKYAVDSNVTDGATSSGPHGLSVSTTLDDDVFSDGTLRETEKTPDSLDELSERSVVKVSPGAVRQEVSQAISDKRGTLIILKEVDDKGDGDRLQVEADVEKADPTVAEKVKVEEEEVPTASKEKDVLPTLNEYQASEMGAKTTVVQTSQKKVETQQINEIKGMDSPKKAKASWVSEMKTEESEVISVSTTKEVMELKKTSDGFQQRAKVFTFEEVLYDQSKSSLTTAEIVNDSSTTSLALVLYEK